MTEEPELGFIERHDIVSMGELRERYGLRPP